MSQRENQMMCHQAPVSIDCSETVKRKYVFKHLNNTHHECFLLEDSKCSSSPNSFETLAECEKECHHDNHHHSI